MSRPISMKVVKRDGTKEDVSFDKVLTRIRRCAGLEVVDKLLPSNSSTNQSSEQDTPECIPMEPLDVNPDLIAQRTLARIHDGVKTSDLDELAAQLAISLVTTHPDYGTLASRIIISNHQKQTLPSFVETMKLLANQRNKKTGAPVSYLSKPFLAAVERFGPELDKALHFERDFLLDYFGFMTLARQKYLLRDITGRVLERPQHIYMRVALAMYPDNLEHVLESYEYMSLKYFIHATPTMFNAGSPMAQMSSCYLLCMSEDSITGIYKTLGDCAQISKYAGGIGLHIHNVRAKDAHINGNGGTSTGIVPMLKNFNATARYVDQGSKRNGSFAIYLEPWHADVEDFLKLKLNTGSEDERARDLFYALWIPDLFMKRIKADGLWTLFCPSEAPGLADVWGPAFETLYEDYEAKGLGRRQVKARDLWARVTTAQIETGTPYLLYKDAANSKSNQQNLGTIKSSNLCVAPETLITTNRGALPIGSLVNQIVSVWNGTLWSETLIQKTNTDQPLITVVIEDEEVSPYKEKTWIVQRSIDCTPYHKFLLESDKSIRECERIEAKDLSSGTKLMPWIDQYGIKHTPVVKAIYDLGRKEDTYCFNEAIHHAGVFNGVLTGNCTEIIEYSDKDETAVCNLASLGLPTFVLKSRTFDFEQLRRVTKIVIRNLNRVIDINFYPVPETRTSNLRHRPVGLGVQGLADVFAMLRKPWELPATRDFHQRIFEHIYFAALEASNEAAVLEGPYETFKGSPASKGILQFDMWKKVPLTQTDKTLDWTGLRAKIVEKGLRNSLLIAPMPTASTSQILGFNECFEPFTSNIYARRTLSGEYIILNKHLIRDLLKLGLWNEDLKNQIIMRNGSVQGISAIPEATQTLFKTAWEIKQRTLLDMAADRGAFICQSQSLNLFVAEPTHAKLSSMQFYAWELGLKTGQYYLRTKAPVMAQKFTIDPDLQKEAERSEVERQKREGEAPEGCLTCSA